MPRALTFDTVRRIGLELPDVEIGTAWGSPALKVHGKTFACMASHKSAEPNTLVIWMDFADRDALIAEDPAHLLSEGPLRGLSVDPSATFACAPRRPPRSPQWRAAAGGCERAREETKDASLTLFTIHLTDRR